jgi:hypothetical protein
MIGFIEAKAITCLRHQPPLYQQTVMKAVTQLLTMNQGHIDKQVLQIACHRPAEHLSKPRPGDPVPTALLIPVWLLDAPLEAGMTPPIHLFADIS